MIDLDRIEAAAKAPDRTHYERVSVSMASLVEMQKMIAERDAVLKQALDFLQRVRHWEEGKPDLHDMKQAIKGVLEQ